MVVTQTPSSQLPGSTEHIKPQPSVVLATQIGYSQGFLMAGSLVKVQTNRTWLTSESPEAPCWGQQGEDKALRLPGHAVTAPPQPSLHFGNQEGTSKDFTPKLSSEKGLSHLQKEATIRLLFE